MQDQDQEQDFVAQDQDAKNESETSRDQDLSLENYITGINNADASLILPPTPFPSH